MMPIQAAIGQRPDISAILRFHLWEPVYYVLNEEEIMVFHPSHCISKNGFLGLLRTGMKLSRGMQTM